jgi:hypothetical protein
MIVAVGGQKFKVKALERNTTEGANLQSLPPEGDSTLACYQ